MPDTNVRFETIRDSSDDFVLTPGTSDERFIAFAFGPAQLSDQRSKDVTIYALDTRGAMWFFVPQNRDKHTRAHWSPLTLKRKRFRNSLPYDSHTD